MAPGAPRLTCPRCYAPTGHNDRLKSLCPECLLRLALPGRAADKNEATACRADPLLNTALASIGRYQLLELVGEGGMGLVYLAEQNDPVRRNVALKILKRGGETPEILARFEVEGQALAALHHPAIAQVYDAGTAPDGRPFIVMEYVAGRPLTEYCDERRLDIRARLELFVITCGAIHHANLNGIVHRDLKPANILVTEENGRSSVKVIDFGLAKAIEPNLTGHTSFTRAGTLMGTPEYMSPEQADPLPYGIDHRADVYSLGVILYELLVGTTPFHPDELRARGTWEVLRTLREKEPPRLVERLRAAGEGANGIAACRQTDRRSLVRQLRGDLDSIVQKALEKRPEERYADVRALATDVERFLRHEPVLACQWGAVYRSRKFVVRHRLRVGGVAIGVLALAVGFGASRLLSNTNRRHDPSPDVIRPIEVQTLTHSGEAWHGVISPDGRLVVFIQETQGQSGPTLWVADRTTWGAERLVVPPMTSRPILMGWSRDGEHLYYGVPEAPDERTYSVYRYSLRERHADMVSERAAGVALSPDETHVANVRNDPATGRSTIVVQELSGTTERVVALRSFDDPYSGSFAWSPDGRTLSTSVGQHGTPKRIVGIDVETGRERSLSLDTWHYAGAKVWLADGRTLLIAGEKSGDSERNSLYRLDTQTGASFRVDTGLEHISGWHLSASADGRTVAATHSWFSAKLFVLPAADWRRALDLGPAFAEAPAFLPHDRLLFTGDDGHLWVVNSDGSNRRRFSSAVARHPAASVDGRVLVAAKRQRGFLTLWRMPTDGSALTPFPESRAAWLSDVTPDGQWIVYITGDDSAVWKLATAGGQPLKLFDGTAGGLNVAPDGRTVAVFRQQSGSPWEIALIAMEGGRLLRRQAVPSGTAISAGIHFAQNGSAVDLVRVEGNVGNLWRVPIGRGNPVQLTHFVSERIQSFDWSRDERLLAVVRGGWRGDIVLLRGEALNTNLRLSSGPLAERRVR